jgi:hypothetical protein
MAFIGLACVGICLNNGLGCRILMNIGWCFFSVFLILGFLVGLLLFPLSYAALESCEVLDITFNSPKGFNRWTSFISNDIKSKVEVCFFQDGDINRIFNMTEIFSKIDELAISVKNFNMTQISESKNGALYLEEIEKQIYFLNSAVKLLPMDKNPNFALERLFLKNINLMKID